MENRRIPQPFILLVAVLAGLALSYSGAGRAAVAAPDAQAAPAADDAYARGEILVELNEPHAAQARGRFDSAYRVRNAQTGIPSLDTLGRRFGIREMKALLIAPGSSLRRGVSSRLGNTFVIKLGEGQSEIAAVAEYRRDPAVRTAQLNFRYTPDRVPNDPLYSQQYAHQRTSAEGGWDISTGEGASRIVIGVIGEGTQLDHPDLAANIVAGYDFASNDSDPSPATGETHETAVSGCAAAVTNNALGVASVCWGCRIMPLRIDYTTATASQAIDYASAHGARVINMSFGSNVVTKYGTDTIVEISVNQAVQNNVVVVASAGNNSNNEKHYPGALDNVVAVASTDSADQRSAFSTFGSWVDVAAPGTSVLTTSLGGGYAPISGTSFSSPYVAGLAGLILSKNSSLTSGTVRLMIEYSADHVQTDHFIGSGRVNVARAVGLNGAPTLFAVIKSPENDDLIINTNTVTIFGTALGDSYVLEYKPQSSASWTQFASGAQTINGNLGVLDVTSLSVGFYDVRLTATRGASQDQNQITLFRSGTYQAGWPQATGSAIVASPSYADLDGDGRQEILVGNNGGQVYVYRQDGTIFPGWPQSGIGPYVFSSPSVGDIDGDGDLEIAVGNYGSAYVSVWHHTGVPVSGFPKLASSIPGDKMRGAIVMANLDADPALEMVLATEDGVVHVWNGDGSEVPGWPQTVDSNVQTTPAVGDIDSDGQVEIVIRQWKKIYVFNADGTTVPGWPRLADGGHTSPGLGDIDGNGTTEIVDAETSAVAAYDGAGNLRFRTVLPASFNYSGLALGDVDGNGTLEVFVGADNGEVYGLSSLGAVLPGWPVSTGLDVTGGPAIADVDGDGQREIIAASQDKLLYVWNPDGTTALGPYSLGSVIYGAPAVGDIDNDGDVELIDGNGDGEVHILDLPGAWDPLLAEWPMYQAEVRHSGRYRAYEDPDHDGEPNIFDCGPLNPAVHHGAIEVCDLIDNNCDGVVDESPDQDGDGFTICGGDCNDLEWTVHPGAVETCNWYDDNCNGVVDEGFDADGDGYISCHDDCNDANASIHPGATETCNNIDDNCNFRIDEGIQFDQDQDGWTICALPKPDCNDNDARINGIESGGLGWENISCFDGLDNDCDGVVDWDCALDVGNERLQDGSVSPKQPGGLNNMKSSSVDDTYELLKESSQKKLTAFWTFYIPTSNNNVWYTWYDLRVEGLRSSSTADNFIFSWATRTQAGACTETTGETYSPALTVTKTVDDDRLQYFQIGPPPAGFGDKLAFCVKAVDSNPSGSDRTADTLKLDKLYLMPIILNAMARSEQTQEGTRFLNNYLATQSSGGGSEGLREGGTLSRLIHTYTMTVPLAAERRLYIEALKSASVDNDNFQFYWAVPSDPNNFQPIPGALITSTALTGVLSSPFGPANYTGTMYIRVMDTDRTPGNTSLDSINIDYLGIKSTP